MVKRPKGSWATKTGVFFAGWSVVCIYYWIFAPFFPIVFFLRSNQGFLGPDYALGLPMLLDGYFWVKLNGLLALPWFTPSICGGVPAFADPINFFYSLPQLLTFFVDPYQAVSLTFFIFAPLGFWGSYFLLRHIFGAGRSASLLGATLFLFNGFYTYRMIIGHFILHSFMLVPWCALFILKPVTTGPKGAWRDHIFWGGAAGILMAYMVYSGMQTLLPPVWLSIAAIGLLCSLVYPEKFNLAVWGWRLGVSVLLALALSAAKLSAVIHFMSNISRTQYSLPQFSKFTDLLRVLLESLFWNPPWELAGQSLVNMKLFLDRHEFEYGLTMVPLVIICAGLLIRLFDIFMRRQSFKLCASRQQVVVAFLLASILAFPLALNIYSPSWNQFLKIVPVVKSLSQNIRWFSLYIPIIVVMTAVVMERISFFKKHQLVLSMVGLALVILWNSQVDKEFYRQQTYSPDTVIASYRSVKYGDWQPGITSISLEPPPAWWRGENVTRNDSLVYGQSPMAGWYSMFGYQLENLPLKSLVPGSVLMVSDSCLNIKNPACYVFPRENSCQPGDHFTVEQKGQAFAFAHYRPFEFKISLVQKIANIVTGFTLFLVLAGLAWSLFFLWRRYVVGSRVVGPVGHR